jgi:two-component system chemotaxis response regulator CheB
VTVDDVDDGTVARGRDVVAIGGSAGALEAMRTLVASLPKDLDAAVFVALHVSPHGPGLVPGILSRSGPLPAEHATDGEPIRKARIYVAPPDRHLLVDSRAVRVTRGARENFHRPAIDALFRSGPG